MKILSILVLAVFLAVSCGSGSTPPDCVDIDGDGYGIGADCLGPDCDDSDSERFPGKQEVCDDKDNDCDGEIDEGLSTDGDGQSCATPPDCVDLDGDGYGIGTDCLGPDCDDSDSERFPGQQEVCDDKDNDCDGEIDEGLSTDGDGQSCATPPDCVDLDGDGYGIGTDCLGPDCDDSDSERFPGQQEVCDDKDNDCDGEIDEGLSTDGDGQSCATPPDCVDLDGDGYGIGTDCLGPDCDDSDSDSFPGQQEVCDDKDNDCDGEIDEGLSTDGDGQSCGASDMEYGETGPYTMVSETFENSKWRLSDGGVPVTVLFPAEITDPLPVLFFSHGYGGTDWKGYESLLTHLVSRGNAVVHSPYPSMVSVTESYEILWNGFQEATDRYATQFKLQKVGFLGHSFGAGATPALAWKGLVEEGWGTQAAFMFMMAPWYSYEISDSQLEAFPNNVNMIMQVYNKDRMNDHLMAIDIYTNIAIPDSRKAYYNIMEGIYTPDHLVPSDLQRNELDRLAVRKPLDALVDYTFDIAEPQGGKDYALDGQGEHFQHTVTKNPAIVAPESQYIFKWSSFSNPRYEK